MNLMRDLLPRIETTFTKGLTTEDRFNMLLEFWPSCPQSIRKLINNTTFLSEPASTKYHGNYQGGLFDHSMNVAKVLRHFTDVGICSGWEREDSPEIVGVLHDFTKVGKYKWNHLLGKYEYAGNVLDFGGHGSDSVIKLSQYIQLTTQEVTCIRFHMGAFETEDWKNYGLAINIDPNVLWVHTADMYASHVLEVRV